MDIQPQAPAIRPQRPSSRLVRHPSKVPQLICLYYVDQHVDQDLWLAKNRSGPSEEVEKDVDKHQEIPGEHVSF